MALEQQSALSTASLVAVLVLALALLLPQYEWVVEVVVMHQTRLPVLLL